THYCRNVPAGTTSCAGIAGADFVTNPKHQPKGVWTDPTPVRDAIAAIGLAQNLVDDPIAMEAMRIRALQLRPGCEVRRPDAAADGCDGPAGLLRLPHADDERQRARQSVPAPVRVH